MGMMASQITSLTIVYSTVYSGPDQRKHQSSASLACMWGIHRWPVNSTHKWSVMRKMFPFDDIMTRYDGHRWRLKNVWIDGQSICGSVFREDYKNAVVLNTTYCHDVNFIVMTTCSINSDDHFQWGCHYDNLQYQQWWLSCHYDKPQFSVRLSLRRLIANQCLLKELV